MRRWRNAISTYRLIEMIIMFHINIPMRISKPGTPQKLLLAFRLSQWLMPNVSTWRECNCAPGYMPNNRPLSGSTPAITLANYRVQNIPGNTLTVGAFMCFLWLDTSWFTHIFQGYFTGTCSEHLRKHVHSWCFHVLFVVRYKLIYPYLSG